MMPFRPSARSTERSDTRSSAPREGTIVFNDGRASATCLVRNLKTTGAELETSAVGRIPDHFGLRLDGIKMAHCRVTWRRLRVLGVEFVQPH